VVSDVPAEVTTGRVEPEDFDPTTSALRDGIENFAIRQALSEIDGWEQKLEESGDPQLAPIAVQNASGAAAASYEMIRHV